MATLVRDLPHAARYYLGNRRALLIIALVALIGGVAMNWSWLVAAGFAPILLSVLPCLVMCGLGLCMHKKAASSGTSQSQPDKTELPTPSLESAHATPAIGNLLSHVSSCCSGGAGANVSADQRKTAAKGDPHA